MGKFFPTAKYRVIIYPITDLPLLGRNCRRTTCFTEGIPIADRRVTQDVVEVNRPGPHQRLVLTNDTPRVAVKRRVIGRDRDRNPVGGATLEDNTQLPQVMQRIRS